METALQGSAAFLAASSLPRPWGSPWTRGTSRHASRTHGQPGRKTFPSRDGELRIGTSRPSQAKTLSGWREEPRERSRPLLRQPTSSSWVRSRPLGPSSAWTEVRGRFWSGRRSAPRRSGKSRGPARSSQTDREPEPWMSFTRVPEEGPRPRHRGQPPAKRTQAGDARPKRAHRSRRGRTAHRRETINNLSWIPIRN